MFDLNSPGCTVDRNLNTVNKKKGYFVALTDNEVIDGLEKEVSKLNNVAQFLHLNNFYYGYWKDEKTEKKYLDISIHVSSKKMALELGKLHNQKAVYDCRQNDCLYI